MKSRYAWLALGALLLAIGLAGACAEDDAPPEGCAEALPSVVEDPDVRIYLSRLKSAHEVADAAIERNERRVGIEALDKAVAQRPVSDADPAREATADALGRLAELHSAEGAYDAALSAVDQGLELAPDAGYLQGRLYEVRGGVELARAEDSPEDVQRTARERAAEAFERSAAVQREVVERARACASTSQVVDVGLVAFLSLAESTHRLADIAEQENELATAEALLTELASGALASEAPAEAREVLADTYARLAELKSARGQFDAARRDVERGLELAVERTHYRGRLMEVLGLVEERLHDALLTDGRTDEAEAAKKRAIEAFESAVAIQDEVIRSTLDEH